MSSSDESKECPLCMEPFELDDANFYPCVCGYQICRFCWHRIRTNENGLCPACRQTYHENPAQFKPLKEEEILLIKKERRQKDQQRKQKAADNRRHLANIRVIQKTLVFVVGLSPRIADAETLKSMTYFGHFGRIIKVVINPSTTYAGSQRSTQGPSMSAYITYSRVEDCLRAIQTVNNMVIDGRVMKASLGTTKYCSHFLKGSQCPKQDCMYLHERADTTASFTKDDMGAGKHTEYEQSLVDQYLSVTHASATAAATIASSPGPGRVDPPSSALDPTPSEMMEHVSNLNNRTNGPAHKRKQETSTNDGTGDVTGVSKAPLLGVVPLLNIDVSRVAGCKWGTPGSSENSSSSVSPTSLKAQLPLESPDVGPPLQSPQNDKKSSVVQGTTSASERNGTLDQLGGNISKVATGPTLEESIMSTGTPPNTVTSTDPAPLVSKSSSSKSRCFTNSVTSPAAGGPITIPSLLSLPTTAPQVITSSSQSEAPEPSAGEYQPPLLDQEEVVGADFQDDDLGFDPWDESARGLADLLEKEAQHQGATPPPQSHMLSSSNSSLYSSLTHAPLTSSIPPGFDALYISDHRPNTQSRMLKMMNLEGSPGVSPSAGFPPQADPSSFLFHGAKGQLDSPLRSQEEELKALLPNVPITFERSDLPGDLSEGLGSDKNMTSAMERTHGKGDWTTENKPSDPTDHWTDPAIVMSSGRSSAQRALPFTDPLNRSSIPSYSSFVPPYWAQSLIGHSSGAGDSLSALLGIPNGQHQPMGSGPPSFAQSSSGIMSNQTPPPGFKAQQK